MSYQFTARALTARPGNSVVPLINGGMEQRGYPWQPAPDYGWPVPVQNEVAEIAILDDGYCLDAPSYIPAGACYGMPHGDGEFATAFQRTLSRDEHP